MRGGFKSLLFRYGISVLLFVAIIALSRGLRYFGLQINLTIPVIVAIVGAAWFGGRGPGILISLLIIVVSMFSANQSVDASLLAFFFQYASILALLIFVVLLVSGRKTAQEQARRQGDLFRTILASIGDALIATDSMGKVTFVNAIATELLGADEKKLVGRPLEEVYRLKDESRDTIVDNVFDSIKRSEEIVSFASGLRLLRPDGTELPIRDSAAPIIDDQGEFCGSVIVFQDDTPRLAAEQALREAEYRQQQSQKLEAVGTLTGGVAHDFNNLLTAILGYTQLAMRKLPNESPVYSNLINVEKASNRAAELTKKLLAFSRQQPMQRRVIDLNEAIAEMLKLLERVIGENIGISFKAADDLALVLADAPQIEQVIMNLTVNARDAMPKGGRLTIETRNVVLDEYYCRQYPSCIPGEYVQVLVSDDGHGMEQDVLDRIFEPFFTTKEVDKGTGLGLSMVYGIVKQHKGHINVYSEVGLGTAFKIYLPAASTSERKEDKAAQPALIGGSETVLVADDEEALRELSRDVLEALGYTVITAENGEEALEIYQANPNSIDLVLLDVVMPVMGGLETYQKICETNDRPAVIFMTGYSAEVLDASTEDRPFDLDELPIIQKPYTLDALGRKVRDVLDASSMGRSPR